MSNKLKVNIRLTQIDGKLPNLALMRLSAWLKRSGHFVHFSRSVSNSMFEPIYQKVYGFSIFSFSQKKQAALKRNYPLAMVGGTGTHSKLTLDDMGVPADFQELDYSHYPEFNASIGFTQRGCRLKCKFCVVPEKEGKQTEAQTIGQLWRGGSYPKHLHLLDNDFFGSPNWQKKCDEMRNGGFRVCFSQGINVRLINKDGAQELARLDYRDNQFKSRRIYTAWDNLGDEKIFTKGINMLFDAGIKPSHIMAYMLIGFKKNETLNDRIYRVERMQQMGVLPYPMAYANFGDIPSKELRKFQRWVVRRYYQFMPYSDYLKLKPTADDMFNFEQQKVA